MIIYGWNSKLLKHAPLENVQCNNCKESTVAHLGIHSSYVHLFWIPLFPYSKKATLVCASCQHITKEKEMTPDFKLKIKTLKKAVPLPKYQFAGLAILLAVAVYFNVQRFNETRNQKAYVNAPKAGDVYVLKNDDEPTVYKYSLFKIVELEGDSIEVSPNSLSYSAVPINLDPNDGFYDYTIKVSKFKVAELNENGALKKVIRDYNDQSGFHKTLAYIEEPVNDDAFPVAEE